MWGEGLDRSFAPFRGDREDSENAHRDEDGEENRLSLHVMLSLPPPMLLAARLRLVSEYDGEVELGRLDLAPRVDDESLAMVEAGHGIERDEAISGHAPGPVLDRARDVGEGGGLPFALASDLGHEARYIDVDGYRGSAQDRVLEG